MEYKAIRSMVIQDVVKCMVSLETKFEGAQDRWEKLKQVLINQSAQHHAHLTPETQATSQAVINAEALEPSDSVPQSAQAQVA